MLRVSRAPDRQKTAQFSPVSARFAARCAARGVTAHRPPHIRGRANATQGDARAVDDRDHRRRRKLAEKPAEPALKSRENTPKNFCVFCANSVESIGHPQIIRRCFAGACKPAGDNVCCPKSKQTSLTWKAMGGAGAIWAVP
jgi:hypothetical protein